jgi:hypothetical protein
MGRSWKRKTASHGVFDGKVMHDAVAEVLSGKSLRSVAEERGLKKSTLQRYVVSKKKLSENDENGVLPTQSLTYRPHYDHARVFSGELEKLLAEYCLESARMNWGLSPTECCKLAYELAVANSLKIPNSWEESMTAGYEWFRGFLKRQQTLSVRVPEATSLSRSTSFNRENVSAFFNTLEALMKQYKFDADAIYNVDESGLTTVQKPAKIVAEKGCKQVGKMTSAERGALVTICATVNAIGNHLPPFLIFPRVNFKQHMLKGAPPGSTGVANVSRCRKIRNFSAAF